MQDDMESTGESVTQQQDEENFLDPLVFNWDEEKFIVSEAVRCYVAQFDADHQPCDDVADD